jgi:hypothetical protein
MLIDDCDPAVGHAEAKIRSSLVKAQELDSNVDAACDQFEVILVKVLRMMPGNCEWRYWSLEELCYDSFARSDHVVTLQGLPYWFSDVEGCDRFRIDVALDTDPLLYSFKFSNGTSGEQLLYVGKTPQGWVVNGTRASKPTGQSRPQRGRNPPTRKR